MDAKRYLELKEKGTVTLVKAGRSFAIEVKRFDPDTGAELGPAVEAVDLDTLTAQKQALVNQAQAIQQLKDDLKALP